MRTPLNVVCLLHCGIWLAIGYISLAWANIKLIPVSLVPFGRVIAPVEATQDQPLQGRLASGSSGLLTPIGPLRRAQ